jgi:hypothetical protein
MELKDGDVVNHLGTVYKGYFVAAVRVGRRGEYLGRAIDLADTYTLITARCRGVGCKANALAAIMTKVDQIDDLSQWFMNQPQEVRSEINARVNDYCEQDRNLVRAVVQQDLIKRAWLDANADFH